MGEDLPVGVYRQWRHWCQFRHYFFDDPLMAHVAQRFERVTMPMVAATAMDDAWATPASVQAFMKGYKNAQLQLHRIPADDSVGPIGHMGYFRPQARPIWETMLAWFDAQLQTLQADAGTTDDEDALTPRRSRLA
jgi:predicted alpha/beta hydrolase